MKMLKLFSLLQILLPVLFSLTSFSQTSSSSNYQTVRTDFTLTMDDGTVIDCTKFIPQSYIPGGFPAVIFLHGFGGSKEDVIPFAENISKKGFSAYTYSMRGQGKSTGTSYLISRIEMNDLIKIIGYVKNEPPVNLNKVALAGSSQGGILSFMAVSNGADVRCAVADLSSPEFASSWIENGCVKMTLFWSLNYDSTIVKYSNEVRNYRRWILSGKKDKWDSLAAHLPENRDFMQNVKNISVPIYFSNAWQDKFFNTMGMIKASYLIPSPFKMYFGAVQGHGSDTVYSEELFHSQSIDKWLDYWLYGIENGIMENRFTYTSSSHPIVFNHWTYSSFVSDRWPPEGMSNLKLYFLPGNRLSEEQNLTNTDTVSILNDVREKKLSMEEAIKSGFTGYEFNSKYNKTYIYFETDPLEREIQFAGTPLLNLVYSSTANICQYNFQIWEVQPNGEINFVTRINYTDRNYRRNQIKQKPVTGISYSHIFKQGYRIRIYVTNIDNGPADSFLGTNPSVLPILIKARNYIYMGKEKPSYIELPVILR